jgi:hypothetical protein
MTGVSSGGVELAAGVTCASAEPMEKADTITAKPIRCSSHVHLKGASSVLWADIVGPADSDQSSDSVEEACRPGMSGMLHLR